MMKVRTTHKYYIKKPERMSFLTVIAKDAGVCVSRQGAARFDAQMSKSIIATTLDNCLLNFTLASPIIVRFFA